MRPKNVEQLHKAILRLHKDDKEALQLVRGFEKNIQLIKLESYIRLLEIIEIKQ